MIGEQLFPEKPDNLEMFCTTEVAKIAGCAFPTVRQIATRLGIQAHIYRTNNARAAYYTSEEVNMICENYNVHGNNYKAIKKVEQPGADDQALHPLVTDKKCLQFSYWPDITPVCFKELDR